MSSSNLSKLTWGLLGLFSMLLLVVYAWPIAKIGTFNLEAVRAINTDEWDYLNLCASAFQRGDFFIYKFDYGLLYYNIGLAAIYLIDLVIPMDTQKIIEFLRIQSFVFLILTALLCFDYGKRFVSFKVGLATFIGVLISSITTLWYGAMLHPDTCQLFFVVLSFYGLARYNKDESWTWMFTALMASGFAFSTKYAGVALLPMIWLVLLTHNATLLKAFKLRWQAIVLMLVSALWFALLDVTWISSYITQDVEETAALYVFIELLRIVAAVFTLVGVFYLVWGAKKQIKWFIELMKALFLLISSSTVFFLAFIIGSPQSIVDFNFLNGFLYITNAHRDGHWFRNESGLWGWAEILGNSETLGWFWLLFGLLGVILIFSRIKTLKWNHPQLLPFYWMLSFLVVIIFRIKSKFSHYLIPIIPVIVFYAAIIIDELLKRIFKEKERVSSMVFGLLVLVYAVWQFGNINEFKNKKVNRFETSPAMSAGYWLEKNAEEGVVILTDNYVYIPPFYNYKPHYVWGVLPQHIKDLNPDYVIIEESIFEQFVDPERVKDYLHGADVYMARHKLYADLLKDENEEYKLVQDFGEVKIYTRRKG
ncbi:MAG: ArnT family glycosyltransferase [Salibacteraceae bacterium]